MADDRPGEIAETAVLRALAHPLRWALIEALGSEGTATATRCAELLGESQRAVTRLLRDTIPELAMRRPHTIVLIDEVESFAVARSAASMETNPVDVHRSTDAVLAGIDAIAADLPRVLFLTTTNFLAGVDDAFLSRADLVVTFELPDTATIASIIRHSLAELAGLERDERLARGHRLPSVRAGLLERAGAPAEARAAYAFAASRASNASERRWLERQAARLADPTSDPEPTEQKGAP